MMQTELHKYLYNKLKNRFNEEVEIRDAKIFLIYCRIDKKIVNKIIKEIVKKWQKKEKTNYKKES